MPTYYLYGDMTFTNRQGRDRATELVVQQAPARGFTAEAWAPFFPVPGVEPYTAPDGRLALRLCYSHTNSDLVAQATNVLNQQLESQGWADGVFGWSQATGDDD